MSESDKVLEALGAVGLPVGASLLSFATGAALLLDDAKDFGELVSTGLIPLVGTNDPHPHHWILGLLLMCGGLLGIGLSLMSLVTSDPKVVEELRNRAEELRIARKTLPPNMLEAFLKG
jgi:hypothetical protein